MLKNYHNDRIVLNIEKKSGMERNVIWLIMSWDKPLLKGELLHVTLRSMLLMRILVTIMLES